MSILSSKPTHGFVKPRTETSDDLEVTRLDVSENGLAGIADLLSGLYQDGPFAVFREYVSNAYDSHVKAGMLGVKPVEILLPAVNWSQPSTTEYVGYDGKVFKNKTIFQVKDYGTGMTHEEMKTIYVKYGNSTKVGDRNTIGRFGVGAKSALSMEDYFEIISVKDGEKILATIERDNLTGISHMYTKSITPTDEPNGFTVRIPVSYSFRSLVEKRFTDYFSTWGPNTVVLNGETPKNLNRLRDKTKYLEVVNFDGQIAGWVSLMNPASPTLERSSYAGYNNLYMGGVPYNVTQAFSGIVPQRLTKLTTNGQKIIINLPGEALRLTPNRENIKITEENENRIKEAYKLIETLLPDVAKQFLNSLNRNEAQHFWANNYLFFDLDYATRSSAYSIYNSRSSETHEKVVPLHKGELLTEIVDLEKFYSKEQYHIASHKTLTKNVLPVPTKISTVMFNAVKPLNEDAYLPQSSENSPTLNIVVWGKYTGKATNPFATHARNAMRQLGWVDVEHVNVLHLKVDEEPPAEILNSFKVFTMDKILELSKTWRLNHYKQPERKPKTIGKSVASCYYIVFRKDENNVPTVELWDRNDVKQNKEKVYYIEEADFQRSQKGYIWDDIRLSFSSWLPSTKVPGNLREEASVAERLNVPVVLIPHKKSLNAFLNAAEEGTVSPLTDYVMSLWEEIPVAEKKYLLLIDIHIDHYSFPPSNSRNVDKVENVTVREALKETTDSNSPGYKKIKMFNNFKAWNSYTERKKYVESYENYLSQTSRYSLSVELFNKMVELADI